MRVILFILQKEFRQIFRNKGMIPIIFVMPIVQLIILVNAADFEIKNIRMTILDEDHSEESRRLIGKFQASHHFNVQGTARNYDEAMVQLDENKTDAILRIPARFGHYLNTRHRAGVGVELNGIDGSASGLAAFYMQNTIFSFNIEMLREIFRFSGELSAPIDIRERYWFNPYLNYKNYMVPGLLVILVTMVGMFLSSMNIVREKEIGTAEQINVSPIKKYQFIVGKLFPFWVIGMFELAFGLLIGKLIYDIPIEGPLTTVFAFGGVYLLVVQGIGLFVSTVTHTQQQAMFVSWFFMVIFILMSGLFTPIENMPDWAQKITWFNPIAYFVKVIRLVLLTGSGFAEVWTQFVIILGFATGINLMAVLSYRKRV